MTESQILEILPTLATLNAWARGSYEEQLGLGDAQGVVYFIKNRTIKAALDLGMCKLRFVSVDRPCNVCKGTGDYERRDYDGEYYGSEDCRRCNATGKVTLRFAEAHIGDRTFHTPRPRAAFLQLEPSVWDSCEATDWAPEQPGAKLDRFYLIHLLNELERVYLAGKMVRWGDVIWYRDPFHYHLQLEDETRCWVCGWMPAITQWNYGHDIYRPGLRWKQWICDTCRGVGTRRPRQWPATLTHPKHDRGQYLDEGGWTHAVPMPAVTRDGPVREWLARRGIVEGYPVPGDYAFAPTLGNCFVSVITIKDGVAYVVPSRTWLDIYDGLTREKPMLQVPAEYLRGWLMKELGVPRC